MTDEKALVTTATTALATELGKDAAKGVAQVAVELYDDGVRPWAEIVGNAGRLLGLPFVWLAHLAATLRPRVPEEKLVAPPKVLALPILQALPAAEDEPELREMFLELLTKSMTSDQQNEVHPAYAKILGELSPDEARLLPALLPVDELKPGVFLRAYAAPAKGGSVVAQVEFISIGSHVPLVRPEARGLYFENIRRLGIVLFDYTREHQMHEPFLKSAPVAAWITTQQTAGRQVVERKFVLEVIDFGAGFIRACLGSAESARTAVAPPGGLTPAGGTTRRTGNKIYDSAMVRLPGKPSKK